HEEKMEDDDDDIPKSEPDSDGEMKMNSKRNRGGKSQSRAKQKNGGMSKRKAESSSESEGSESEAEMETEGKEGGDIERDSSSSDSESHPTPDSKCHRDKSTTKGKLSSTCSGSAKSRGLVKQKDRRIPKKKVKSGSESESEAKKKRAEEEQEDSSSESEIEEGKDEKSDGRSSPDQRNLGKEAKLKGSEDSSGDDSEVDDVEGKEGKKNKDSSEDEMKRWSSPSSRSNQEVEREDHPTIKRLKRYILTCGARRNYKKLFQGCRSNKAKIQVLRKELENLGVKGNPSLEKCKAVKLKREEDEELASLDISNIIHTQGRPRRRSVWNPYQSSREEEEEEQVLPSQEGYKKTLASDSDSSEEGQPAKKRLWDWSNLKGIISDEGESD
uniref:HIRA interacting protein 3 n=1 Tax=Latimeria chalumnae TaxID=7897 RepID=H2ZTD1_LATCH